MNDAACAHLHVEYFSQKRDDGSTEGWWACRDCRGNFLTYALHYAQIAALEAEVARLRVIQQTIDVLLAPFLALAKAVRNRIDCRHGGGMLPCSDCCDALDQALAHPAIQRAVKETG